MEPGTILAQPLVPPLRCRPPQRPRAPCKPPGASPRPRRVRARDGPRARSELADGELRVARAPRGEGPSPSDEPASDLPGALRHLAVRPYARRARRAALARAAGRGGPPGALQLQGLRRGGAGRQDDDSRRGSVSAAAARSRRPSVRRPSFR